MVGGHVLLARRTTGIIARRWSPAYQAGTQLAPASARERLIPQHLPWSAKHPMRAGVSPLRLRICFSKHMLP
jgi:hypothetical protein